MKSALWGFAILLVLASAAGVHAFTTDELIRLKEAGISEETIVFLVENGCADADRVLRLAKAGFKEETIRAIVTADANAGRKLPAGGVDDGGRTEAPSASPGTGPSETAVRARIDWYMIFRGEPLRRNFQDLEDAKGSLVEGRTIRIAHRTDSGAGLLELFRKKAFPSPFLWNLEGTESFKADADGYRCVITSVGNRRGKPPSDGSHFWVLSLDPKDPGFCDSVREALEGMKGARPR